jgi:H+-transporting ATPase
VPEVRRCTGIVGNRSRRLERYGYNEIAEEKRNPILTFLSYFWGPIPWMIEIEALVFGTGTQTYFGRTAHLVEEAHTVSHFQRAVLKIGDYLIIVALALVILILAVALFRGDRMLTTLQFALILTVAAVPVAMPAVLSVTMAVGARLLASKQAIVSRLAPSGK